jgi:hypothetical protein
MLSTNGHKPTLVSLCVKLLIVHSSWNPGIGVLARLDLDGIVGRQFITHTHTHMAALVRTHALSLS